MKKQLILATFCVLFTGAVIANNSKTPVTSETTTVITEPAVSDGVKTETLRSRVTTSVKTTLSNKKIWAVAGAVVGVYVAWKVYQAYQEAHAEQKI